MKTSVLFTVALSALVLAGCNRSTKSNDTAADTTANSDYTATTAGNATASANANADRLSTDVNNATTTASQALGSAATNVATTARMAEWHLNPSDIQDDLNNNRKIIRSKQPEAGAPTGTADKDVIESMVKGRLSADTQIAALKLDVDANKHGEVELKGKANSAEEVGKAIALALDTQGVTKVTSKIKLDKDAKTNR